MGSEAWHYFTLYQGEVRRSLQELRQQEFAARRFYHSEIPSETIEQAITNADAAGTASILDIEDISDGPAFCRAWPVPEEVLRNVFGTAKPERLAVEHAWEHSEAFEDYFVEVDRACACYIVLYQGGSPTEVFFAGWSAD